MTDTSAIPEIEQVINPIRLDHATCSCGWRVLDHDQTATCNAGAAEALSEWLNNHLSPALATLRAHAWDEGYDAGDPWQRRGNPAKAKRDLNPYRADRQQPTP